MRKPQERYLPGWRHIPPLVFLSVSHFEVSLATTSVKLPDRKYGSERPQIWATGQVSSWESFWGRANTVRTLRGSRFREQTPALHLRAHGRTSCMTERLLGRTCV